MWHEDIPVIKTDNASIKVIAGKYLNTEAPEPAPDSWAADALNEVAIWNIKIEANTSYVLPKASADLNRTLYFYEGEAIKIHDNVIDRKSWN